MAGIKSYGITLTFGGTAVPNITDISIPEVDRDMVDVTVHDPANEWRSFVGGLKDGGTFTVSGLHTATSNPLHDEDDDGTAKACVVTFSDSSTATFNAALSGYGVSGGIEGALTYSASLKVSGEVVYAAGA